MANLTESDRRDLDETRRLLYMALVVRRTKKYNLVGTIVNAIKHHQRVDIDTDELIDRVVEYVEGEAEDDGWVRGQIKRIVDVLDAADDEAPSTRVTVTTTYNPAFEGEVAERIATMLRSRQLRLDLGG